MIHSVQWRNAEQENTLEELAGELFDEEGEDFMERSQRKVLRAKRARPSRRGGDWD